jgi:hypothetical protein
LHRAVAFHGVIAGSVAPLSRSTGRAGDCLLRCVVLTDLFAAVFYGIGERRHAPASFYRAGRGLLDVRRIIVTDGA